MDTSQEFTPSNSQPRHHEGKVTGAAVASQLSGPLTALAGSAFVSGVTYGLFEFLQRSPVRQVHVAGTAAWGQQLALAVATIVILSVTYARRRQRFGPRSGRLWLLAPLGRHAALRVARALGFGGEARRAGRVVLALPAAALFLFCFWRAGVQVTGGLDPNFTVNAWGGPSYAGAMACHYLDLFLLAGGAAWLMDRILPA
jgi:nitroreductase